MAVLNKSNNVTTFDIINARCSVALKDAVGEVLDIKAAAVISDEDEGKEYTYLWSEDGTCYAGNSASVREVADSVIEIINEGMKINCEIIKRTSKNGKDFLSLKVSERK